MPRPTIDLTRTDDDGPEVLGRATRMRMRALRLSQTEIDQRRHRGEPGLSPGTMNTIQHGRSNSIAQSTMDILEEVMLWPRGTGERLIDHEITPEEANESPTPQVPSTTTPPGGFAALSRGGSRPRSERDLRRILYGIAALNGTTYLRRLTEEVVRLIEEEEFDNQGS